MTVMDQARAFLAMALCGALLGAVYDALGALRRGRLLTAAADLLFGVLAAAAVIAAALVLRCDAYRLYTLLGVDAGFALYQCSIGTTVRFLKGEIQKVVRKSKKLDRNIRRDAGKWRIGTNI